MLRYSEEVTAGSAATPRRRPGGRSARVREAVLGATLAVLAREGYGGLTVEAVADQAQVHKTTLYRRWGSRQQLVIDALTARGASEIPIPDTGSLRTDLVHLGTAVAANLSSPAGLAVARAVLSAPDSTELGELAGQFWQTRFGAATAIVERAVGRGELPRDTDAEALVEAVVAPLWFRVLAAREPVDDLVVEASVDRAIRAFTWRSTGERAGLDQSSS